MCGEQEGFLKTDADLKLQSGMLECQRIRREVQKSKQQGSDDDDEVRAASAPFVLCPMSFAWHR